jgi:molybdopterin converting factor small subunit
MCGYGLGGDEKVFIEIRAMKLKLIAYGIAKDIVNGREVAIDIPDGSTIADLKSILLQRYPPFSKLKSLSFAVGDEYREDLYLLSTDKEVVIIPPVSGG